MPNNDGQRGEYKEQTVTILSVTQDRIKKGANRGRLYEKYEVEGFSDKTFYNFHDHLIGEISRPVKAKIEYFDDPTRPKVEKVVVLSEELAPVNRNYGDGLNEKDLLMARMSNVKSSIRALKYFEGSAVDRFKLYQQLLQENEEYMLHGLQTPENLDEDDAF
jgi:hypothetical protein